MFQLTLHEQRQESNEEDQENGDNAVLDPVKDRDEVVAARLAGENVALRVDVADGKLLVEGAKVHDWNGCLSKLSSSWVVKYLRVSMKIWME